MEFSPFTDSTRLRRDSAALGELLASDGYLFLRGVLPAQDVAAVRRHVLDVADAAGWLRPAASGRILPEADPAAAVWDPDPAYRAVHRQLFAHRPVHALMHHPALLDLMADLTGCSEPLVHPRKVIRAVHPRPAAGSVVGGWHQDYPEIQGSAGTLTAWTPLAPVGLGTGALALVPGSHRDGVLPLRLAPTGAGWEAATDPAAARTAELRPGDILIFTAHTVHRGTPNTGRGLRMSVDVRYQCPSEPISETCLELRDESYGWDEVYATWPRGARDPLAYYWRSDLMLDVQPYDYQYDHWRNQEALAAGARRDPAARRALELAVTYGPPDLAGQAAPLLNRLPAA
ncbi:phytanoyl-CoA dioxygenase family protein [Streptomyces abikoensis]